MSVTLTRLLVEKRTRRTPAARVVKRALSIAAFHPRVTNEAIVAVLKTGL